MEVASDSTVRAGGLMKRVEPVVLVVFALLALAWALELDRFSGGAWRHWPGLVFTLAPAGLVAAASIASQRRWLRWFGATTLALALLAVVTPWHPRKVFVACVRRIEVGMSVDEVEAIMAGYTKGNGWAIPAEPPLRMLGPHEEHAPEALEAQAARVREAGARYQAPQYPEGEERTRATGTMIYRWCTTDASYNADWGVVEFVDGKVIKAEFWPD